MLDSLFNIGSIGDTISKYVDKFISLVNKITDNGVLASFITVAIFILLCIIINNTANK